MKLEPVPLLQLQRNLYNIPRGRERFQKYLEVMIGGTDDMALPLPAINPMGKEHVAAVYDKLISLDAEAIAADALLQAQQRLSDVAGEFRLGIVVADDVDGAWTNRYFVEFGHLFEAKPLLRRGWITALFWTSERQTKEKVREQVLMSVYRAAHFQRLGSPKTLREMMVQEGRAGVFSGARQPKLDAEDLAYTSEVIGPYLESSASPTVFACLFGDEAARSLGYPALGLSARAGFALALEEARLDHITL